MQKYIKDYEASITHGLQHIAPFLDPTWGNDETINLIETGQGSRSNCLMSLGRFSNCLFLRAYFRDHNLAEMKYWASVSAKLEIMREHEAPDELTLEVMFWAMISDNQELISWLAQHRLLGADVNKPQTVPKVNDPVYARRLALHALKGEWEALGEGSKHALAEPELFKKMKPRWTQYQFWLALAQGDKQAMQNIVYEMCTPKQRRYSFERESGLTNQFIVMFATLYAKLAYHHGYELEIDTPWIPRDWLPVQTLPRYEDPWPFMQRFDIWQPFAEPWSAWSPRKPV